MSKLSNADPSADDQSFTTANRDNAVAVLTPEQIQRWARLIAEGRGELPAELDAASRDLLVEEVRRLLRVRLVGFVARVIAADILPPGFTGRTIFNGQRAQPAHGHGGPMISRSYDVHRPYTVALYLRMSDPKQNRRSPDQQADHIQEVMRRCNCPWRIARAYRNDGIKGRYVSTRRQGLQNLLTDIETGLIEIDLIVVDNLERFGRADEFEPLRQKLKRESGVLIVAADNNFADPTGITGKAVGMIEQIRSTEEGRIKGLNVIRGKKDTLRLRRWPGGPVPLGYRLKRLIDESGPKPARTAPWKSILKPPRLSATCSKKPLKPAGAARGWRSG